MITAIELGNVRIFEGLHWQFRLSPLTVLCGTNSAGKSTILKVLLLLRQTLGIRETTGGGNSKLRFVGSQVDLGNFSSFVSHNQKYRDISIGLSLDGTMQTSLLGQLAPGELIDAAQGFLLDSESELDSAPYSLRCLFEFGYPQGYFRSRSSDDTKESVEDTEEVTEEPAGPGEAQPVLKRAEFDIIYRNSKLLSWTVFLSDTDDKRNQYYRIKFPFSYFEQASGLKGITAEIKDVFDNVEFHTFLRGLLPDRIVARSSEISIEEAKESPWRTWPLPAHMEKALRDLRRGLTKIHYLGPLRSPAKRYYTAQVDPDPVLDPAGEFLPYLLRDRGEMPVMNLRLGEQATRRETLLEALDYWLHYLRTGGEGISAQNGNEHELKLQNIQDMLVQLAVRSVGGSESHALADSGFGYSQLLPILARGLITTPGSTLIVEQPEVHLNPALQVRVTDFLVAMSRAGRQILIETHSEHIVNAVRVLSAEDSSGRIASLSSILYIEATGGRPTIHELSVQRDGSVPEWPRHFFGEAAFLTGRLLRAQRNFRKVSH